MAFSFISIKGKFIYWLFISRRLHLTSYVNNLKEGVSKQYLKNGSLREEVNYKRGKKNGLNVFYSLTGNILSIKQYQNGILLMFQYFDKKERVKTQIHFMNGKATRGWRYSISGNITEMKNKDFQELGFKTE